MSLSALGIANSTISTITNATTASTALDLAVSTVASAYAQLGAQQRAFEMYEESNRSNIVNIKIMRGAISDANMEESLYDMSRTNTQYQIATSMFLEANQKLLQLLSLFN
jgi:flagellin